MPAEILILGGGYAGLAAAGTLARLRRRGADVRVRLIDRNACSVASPMLPDLISGRVGPDRLRHPLGPHCRRLGVEFVRADVREISVTDRQAATDRGSFRADGMIFCLGCENNYFGDEQMRARAPGLKSIAEALAIRSAAERLVDRARGDAGWRPAHLVVVGGGYTGFETASHLADLARRRVGGSFRRLRRFVRVLVVEKGDSVLRNVSPEVRLWAVRLMRAYGLEVRTGVTVASLEPPRAVALTDGTVLDGAMVVWTAGVSPGPACAALSAPGSRAGRLTVDDRLRLAGAERVFAAGDVAGAVRPGTGQPLRMGVQFSLAAGRHAAENTVRALQGRPLKTFHPFDPGYLIPLAPGQAAGVILGRQLRGRIPYALHYAMCALRSWGWKNRLGVLGELLARRRGRGADAGGLGRST